MSRPILLLHGIPVTSTVWRHVMGPLGRYGTVLAPDLPYLGSGGPEAPCDPEGCVRWLEELLAPFPEPVTMVLHDFGGMVGLHWAIRNPRRVERLVIMNTTVYPDSIPLSRLVRSPAAIRLGNRLLTTGPGFGLAMRHLFRLRDEDRIREYRQAYTRPSVRQALDRMVVRWTPEAVGAIGDQVRSLSCPVLLLWGMEDRYVFPWEPHGERFYRDLPHARVARIPEAAHFLQLEQPEQVLGHLDAFLEQT